MLITVFYGDKKEKLFNTDCKCVCLLNSLKQLCATSQNNVIDVDVCDEHGNVKNLRHSLSLYANDLLADRERLILLRVDRKENGETFYTPLATGLEYHSEAFLGQLSSRGSNGNGRRSRNQSQLTVSQSSKSQPKSAEKSSDRSKQKDGDQRSRSVQSKNVQK